MLDVETKNRINTARDILVGKVPDPKSQVEQITIALIYKFMDDMDVESEELGGKRTFFVGEYAKYAWRKIFDPRQSGYELLNLYSEAITKMDTNPGVPKLFRDIFKNAYLPYRDPETLKSFLKIINDFEYSHSEKLGDAFEFLLSILGSQGDAGQFRTPRHIIDFMVEIIDPKKHEVILDPACGTAGFLISSYKHIVKQNSSNYLPEQNTGITGEGTRSVNEVIITTNGYSGDKLTADERKILADNIHGYDISPDMVRLSLVNMYLHGIKEPHISEYDTLTSEDYWNQYCDVILANPPFMSPKGGIRPHKRFSIPSNRSEVLFVDYIAEHLTPDGRAVVIVPEGIIFQSGTAYKNLRKMLVEKYLVGVISLPAGVFQPYSGVKTSILWLDKVLAKKTDKILFVKIENDGFDLGAQRRAINHNDLPEAFNVVADNKERILSGKTEFFKTSIDSMLVLKSKISGSYDINLTGERYKILSNTPSNPDFVRIGDFFQTSSGGTPLRNVKDYWEKGTIPWIKSGEVAQGFINKSEEFMTEKGLSNSSAKLFPINSVLIAMYGATVGQVGLLKTVASTNQAICAILPDENVIPEYLYYLLKAKRDFLISQSVGGAQPNISQTIIKNLVIPIPTLSIQEEIVSEIESYQKIIDGARQVVENYKPRIEIDPEWKMVELGKICDVKGGKRLPKGKNFSGTQTPFPYIRVTDFMEMSIDTSNLKYITESVQATISRYTISKEDVYISIAGTIGLFGTVPDQLDGANLTENAAKLVIKNLQMNKFYLSLIGNSPIVQDQIKRLTHAVGVPKLALERLKTIRIPLPPVGVQSEMFGKIMQELVIVHSNKQLVDIFEQKIKDRIAKVWGE